MERRTIRVPAGVRAAVTYAVAERGYANTSEAVRAAIRETYVRGSYPYVDDATAADAHLPLGGATRWRSETGRLWVRFPDELLAAIEQAGEGSRFENESAVIRAALRARFCSGSPVGEAERASVREVAVGTAGQSD